MRVIIDNAVNDSFAAWKCTQVASCRRHSGAASYSRKGEVAHEVGEQEKLGLEFQEFGYEFRKHLGHFRTRLSSGGEYTIEKFNGRFRKNSSQWKGFIQMNGPAQHGSMVSC